jgi:hypothetical protein
MAAVVFMGAYTDQENTRPSRSRMELSSQRFACTRTRERLPLALRGPRSAGGAGPTTHDQTAGSS